MPISSEMKKISRIHDILKDFDDLALLRYHADWVAGKIVRAQVAEFPPLPMVKTDAEPSSTACDPVL